jgi:DNA-directed RNA polymerase subunit RPC12/RpoP
LLAGAPMRTGIFIIGLVLFLVFVLGAFVEYTNYNNYNTANEWVGGYSSQVEGYWTGTMVCAVIAVLSFITMATGAILPSIDYNSKESQEYQTWKRTSLENNFKERQQYQTRKRNSAQMGTNKNLTLICQDCKTEILSDVKACPYCGSKNVIQVSKKTKKSPDRNL